MYFIQFILLQWVVFNYFSNLLEYKWIFISFWLYVPNVTANFCVYIMTYNP